MEQRKRPNGPPEDESPKIPKGKPKRKPVGEGAADPVEYIGPQRLAPEDQKLLDEAYARLEEWEEDCRPYHQQATDMRKVYRLNDPFQDPPGTPELKKTLQLQTLKSTINNCVSDQIDNTPEALMIPQTPDLQSLATEMTNVVRFILSQNEYETYHRRRAEDFFIAGTAVTQIMWDRDMDDGQGNIAVFRVPIENMIWDPMCGNIQDARAIIKVSWHPMSWFAEHYPEEAVFVGDETHQHNNAGMPDAQDEMNDTHEGRAMLMEYWYRRFRNGRYTINVAYIAGGALLEKYEDVYEHGMYPFQFDAFTPIEGQPVGEGMVYELAPMMRYINRYAHYIDENLRFASKSRMLVRKGSGIASDQLADWERNLVEGNSISEEDVRWFDTKPLNGMVSQQMLQFQNDMKMDSGQNQFSRGETSGGVTAASAIASLQEAGGKITRMRTAALSAGFKKIVEQILWLVSEFYDEEREAMVAGEDGAMQPQMIMLDAEHLMPGHRKKVGGHLPPPPYTVQVVIQRRNPMRVQAQNDLMMQAYSMAAQAGQNFPLSVLFDLLNVDGKDRLMPVLRDLDQQQQMMAQLQQQNQQLQEQNQNMQTSLDSYAQALQSNVSNLQANSFGGAGQENGGYGVTV